MRRLEVVFCKIPKLRQSFPGFVAVALLLCAAVALPYGKRFSQRFVEKTNVSTRDEHQERSVNNAEAGADGMSATTRPVLAPQTSAQFDLSRNVIAGGGGTSSGAG